MAHFFSKKGLEDYLRWLEEQETITEGKTRGGNGAVKSAGKKNVRPKSGPPAPKPKSN